MTMRKSKGIKKIQNKALRVCYKEIDTSPAPQLHNLKLVGEIARSV